MKGKPIISREPGQPSAKQHVQSTMKHRGATLILRTHFAGSHEAACINWNVQFQSFNLWIKQKPWSQTLNYGYITT